MDPSSEIRLLCEHNHMAQLTWNKEKPALPDHALNGSTELSNLIHSNAIRFWKDVLLPCGIWGKIQSEIPLYNPPSITIRWENAIYLMHMCRDYPVYRILSSEISPCCQSDSEWPMSSLFLEIFIHHHIWATLRSTFQSCNYLTGSILIDLQCRLGISIMCILEEAFIAP